MIDMPGNFAVVIHGEYDCVNCFHHQRGQSAIQYYSTRLTEAQLTTGRTEEPLRRCLELIAERQQPEGVVVLGTCPVEVIGDQFQKVVHQVSEATGIPMLPLRTNGLKLGTQADMLDWLNDSLASFAKQPSGATKGRVNLVGLPGRGRALGEVRHVLSEAGLVVNGIYPTAASFSDWVNIANADFNAVVDSGMYQRLLQRLNGFGQRAVDVPFPVGLTATAAFYRAIFESSGRTVDTDSLLSPYTDRVQPHLASFRQRYGGARIAYAMRMKNTYSIANVAYDGLGCVSALEELGFEVELLIQGAPDEDAVRGYRDRLEERGFHLPFHVFSSPPEVIELLRQGRYNVTYLSDSSRIEAQRAGVPSINERMFQPFYSGIPTLIRGLRAALEGDH